MIGITHAVDVLNHPLIALNAKGNYMTLTSALYLVDIVNNLNEFFCILIFVGICILVCVGIAYAIVLTDRDKPDVTAKILKRYWIVILFMLIEIPIPSKSTMYLMLGSTYLEQSNLPKKVGEALELKLDDYIKELKGSKNDNQ